MVNWSIAELQSRDWNTPELQAQIQAVAARYNQEYRGEAFSVPDEVAALPLYPEFAAGSLTSRITSPFWDLAKPQKNWRCLDLGCGGSFLFYPWRDWQAFFYGQDVARVMCDLITARGPQLNSKLFKGVRCQPAHELDYEPASFDLVIATGVSCYYPINYWAAVTDRVKSLLKPGGLFVFDAILPELPLAENWAILETYLGAEVFLEDAADWKNLVKDAGGKITGTREGDVFSLYRVKFS